jgi:hypothetical protein
LEVVAPLPEEVLPPHQQLGGETRLTLHERRLAVLLPREHRHQRVPGGGLTLVDRREVPQRWQEDVDETLTAATPSSASVNRQLPV